ncbi:hypothetical protein LTR08_003099 [Meristemomyces frigidus]|nr:hypothetical protein LTR08_003099 [Meristemomyces frigidus]
MDTPSPALAPQAGDAYIKPEPLSPEPSTVTRPISNGSRIYFRSMLERETAYITPLRNDILTHEASDGSILEPLVTWATQEFRATNVLFGMEDELDHVHARKRRRLEPRQQHTLAQQFRPVLLAFQADRQAICERVLAIARAQVDREDEERADRRRDLEQTLQRMQHAETELAWSRQGLNVLERENRTLLAERKRDADEFRDARIHAVELETELAQAKQDLEWERSQRELERKASEETSVQIVQDLAEERAKVVELTRETESLQTVAGNYADFRGQVDGERSQWKLAMKALKESSVNAVQELAKESSRVVELVREAQSLKKDAEDYAAMQRQVDEERARYQTQFAITARVIVEATQTAEQAARQQDHITKLEAQLESVSHDGLAKLEAAVKKAAAVESELRSALDDERTRCHDLDARNREMNDQRKYQKQVEITAQLIADATQTAEKVAQQQDQIAKLEAQLESVKHNGLVQLKAVSNTAAAIKSELQSALDNERTRCHDLGARNREMNDQHKCILYDRDRLSARNVEMQTQLDEAKNERLRCASELNDRDVAQSQLSAYVKSVENSCAARLSFLQSTVQGFGKTYTRLELKSQAIARELEIAKGECDKLVQHDNEVKQQCNALESRICVLQTGLEQATQTTERLEAQYEQAQRKNQEAVREVDSLRHAASVEYAGFYSISKDADITISGLVSQLAAKASEIHDLTRDLEEARTQVGSLDKALDTSPEATSFLTTRCSHSMSELRGMFARDNELPPTPPGSSAEMPIPVCSQRLSQSVSLADFGCQRDWLEASGGHTISGTGHGGASNEAEQAQRSVHAFKPVLPTV